ncbi:MAG: hypothetical protein IKB86_06205 [Clostridia bacterium]|nr:hypothetical protein [Clostridia bacterium]
MIRTGYLKKYAKGLLEELENSLEKPIVKDDSVLWLKDNKNRIINLCTSLIREIPNKRLPSQDGEIRVLELARELVEQTGGCVNKETVLLTERFNLTFEEYDFLPVALKIFLLRLINKMAKGEENSAYIPNAVRSLILFADIRFDELRSKCLKQENALMSDEVFAMSDAQTQCLYREKIGEIARKSDLTEMEICARASEFAEGVTENLFGKNRRLFLEQVGAKEGFILQNGKKLYFFGIFALVLLFSFAVAQASASILGKVLLVVVSMAPIIVTAVNLINGIFLKFLPAKPPMRIKEELVDEPKNKTAVVQTVLVPSCKAAEESVKSIEEYYLGNRLENGAYLLLADLSESNTKTTPQDEKIIQVLKDKTEKLNKKYGDRFSLIVRHRQERDGIFSGWERKRGAIEELVTFICEKQANFRTGVNLNKLEGVKYICTLDADTVILPDSIKRLVAVLAHPVNKLKIYSCGVSGYGLVQPRIDNAPCRQTLFGKIMSPITGIDSYSLPARELYNDLFSSGTFCGKGVFSVEGYFALVKEKIRPNTVLSHDLLEGELLHSKGANDVSFLDEFPQTAISFYKRRERWIRGDWQLVPWLFSDISGISKWKIFYNLAQSVFSAGIFLQLLVAPFLSSGAYYLCLLAFLELLFPAIQVYLDSVKTAFDRSFALDTRFLRKNALKRAGLSFLFLPYECYSGITAAFKGLWRRLISRKNVLQWSTYASSVGYSSMLENYSFFASSIALAVIFYLICFWQGIGIVTGLAFSILWCLTPYFASVLSVKPKQKEERLLPDEEENLRLLALRTVRFFDEALSDNGYFMPDNLQLKPYLGYALRTSPTNMGFALLSSICALKLNAYSVGYCVESIKNQLEVCKRLEKHRGHLFNWYSLKNKKIIENYVSTVDSGNYCACLIALWSAVESIRKRKTLSTDQLKALGDVVLSCVDGVDEDTKIHLLEYARDFSHLDVRQGVQRIRQFVSDGAIASNSEVAFSIKMASAMLFDFERLSFSNRLLEKIKGTKEFNLKPLKEYLSLFPKSVKETLEIEDFEKTVDGYFWSAGKERYGALIKEIKGEFKQIYNYAYKLNSELKSIEKFIVEFLDEIDFECLFNKEKMLFTIGLNTEQNQQSPSCYDMLCSEARITSLVAIALGKIPAEHWFKLSRPFTRLFESPVCLSWSGTMFEYLMPDIFIKPTENSMLHASAKAAVEAQIRFSAKNGLWGISESSFNSLDLSKEYKYKAFGVPSVAISSFNAEKVISPYSTLLALEYQPRRAFDNVVRLVENGAAGVYGFFEAVDCKRMKEAFPGIVYTHMAHHSGMGLCAIVNFLCDGAIRKMFSSVSLIGATKMLLEEKMPLGILPRKELKEEVNRINSIGDRFEREFISPERQSVELNVLSGENITVEADSRGKIRAFCGECYIGEIFVYVEDDKKRSVSCFPIGDDSANYKTVFYPEKVTYCFEDSDLLASETVVAADEGEQILFNVSLKKKGKNASKQRIILVIKPALNEYFAYCAHPYFNGLFLTCEQEGNRLNLTNNKSGKEISLLAVSEENVSFETDGIKVFGRYRDETKPALEVTGAVKRAPITPIVAGEIEIDLACGEQKEVTFIIENPKQTKNKAQNKAAVMLKEENAKINARANIEGNEISMEQWLLSLKLASCARNKIKCASIGGKPEALWKYSVSDSVPLITVLLDKEFSKEKLLSVIKTADYLVKKGFSLQVMILEDNGHDYFDGQFNFVNELISSFSGLIHHVKKGNMTSRELEEIKAMSFAFISASFDVLSQIKRVLQSNYEKAVHVANTEYPPSKNDWISGEFDCGYGSFISDGKEYYIYGKTPMPWSNILCNERFGTLVTENGGGFSWCDNACLNKITPWYNDAVSDPLGEGLYLRDDKTGRYWSIVRGLIDYGDEHDCIFGKGYAIYRYNGFGIKQKQTVFVHKEESIKVINVKLDNASAREISAYYFLKPVLAERSEDAFRFLSVERFKDGLIAKRGKKCVLLYCKNAEYCGSFQGFFGVDGVSRPNAVASGKLSSCEGEPMLSMKVKAENEFNVFVCFGETIEEIERLYALIEKSEPLCWLEDVQNYWDERIGKIQIETPDRKLNLIFNNWLLYQTITARIQGRCGFYQAGGAYGFRDQLQDCLALILTEPNRVREHILRCARHQFSEGDVQHWWHEKSTGVRTKISDDLLFLPYVATKYASETGDYEIFDQVVPFLEGHSLGEREDLYENAWESNETASLYEHCMRAVKLVIRRSGEHSLPLILGGDWNDGMNTLGTLGKGESVWLGWFFYLVISLLLPICEERNPDDARVLKEHAKKLCRSLNSVCWDGDWFIRAIDDFGRLIGSKNSECCKIDAISQAWSVLSGAGKREYCQMAMESLEKHLLSREGQILKLLTPPFNKQFGAGYIGDYIPGVRENGGQYTHGAIWSAEAFAQMGESEKAYEIIDFINPISHTLNKSGADRYKTEPYALTADIYSNEENLGRGGWSWYTASSGLYFCAVLQDILGVNFENGRLNFDAHIPKKWSEYSVKIDTDNIKADIKVLNPENKSEGAQSITRIDKENKEEIRIVM